MLTDIDTDTDTHQHQHTNTHTHTHTHPRTHTHTHTHTSPTHTCVFISYHIRSKIDREGEELQGGEGGGGVKRRMWRRGSGGGKRRGVCVGPVGPGTIQYCVHLMVRLDQIYIGCSQSKYVCRKSIIDISRFAL